MAQKKSKILKIRHSLAHILAMSVREIFKEVKLGIGPATEQGFFYDFLTKKPIKESDLLLIEKKMKEIIQRNLKFSKKFVSKKEAKKIFQNEPFKLELLQEIKEKEVSIYETNGFVDLCKGPHVKTTKELQKISFKLLKVSGAYWKGDEKKPMLQRVSGAAFETKKELEEYLEKLKDSKERDHRHLGRVLSLFDIDEDVGAGLPLWHPKGALLRQIIEDFLIKEHLKEGYLLVRTPHIGKETLFEKSGHLKLYKENMYSPIKIENERYFLKPMNCPFHIKIYQSKKRSYRDLPLKFFELGTVYRYEKSGVLQGLVRVRGFTQDDAHIFCEKKNLEEEIVKVLNFGKKIFKKFGFENFQVYLSTRPKKYIGSLKEWKEAESTLKKALKKVGLDFKVDPGEGVFYGPKIDIKVKDVIGREWQLTTVQFDFNLPRRFNLYFVQKNGKKERPIMIHRALLGSLERFIALLLEHYKGALPFWLAPEQIWIVPINDKVMDYAKEIFSLLKEKEYRVVMKDTKETVSKRIREGEIQKIPMIVVLGEKEKKEKTVSLREKEKKEIKKLSLGKFLEYLKLLP